MHSGDGQRATTLCLPLTKVLTMSRELTAKWLRQQTPQYRNADRVYVDVLNVLDGWSLRPKTDVYSTDLSWMLLSLVYC